RSGMNHSFPSLKMQTFSSAKPIYMRNILAFLLVILAEAKLENWPHLPMRSNYYYRTSLYMAMCMKLNVQPRRLSMDHYPSQRLENGIGLINLRMNDFEGFYIHNMNFYFPATVSVDLSTFIAFILIFLIIFHFKCCVRETFVLY